jgi:tRNA (mo5U34)-methyltransferase
MDAAEIRRLRWYHTIDLPDGSSTPGEYDLRPIVDRLPWPDSMAGMRCLDIGSRDGFYAFEMERRGAAEVISLDLDDPRLVNFPGPRPPQELVQKELDDGNRAFETARDALGSKVIRSHVGIYDLDQSDHGRFDFAVIGTLLHHLRDPARALDSARSVLDGHLLLNEAVIPGLDSLRSRPMAEVLISESPFWEMANTAGQRRMMEAAGFEIVDSGRPYLIPYGEGGGKMSLRWCFAGPLRDAARRLLVVRRGALHAWTLGRAQKGPG